MPIRLFVLVLAALVFHAASAGVQATSDSRAARAVLDALANPQLTQTQALAVARLPGNQALVRKAREQKVDTDEASLAEALVEAAHGHGVTERRLAIFKFETVRAKADAMRALLDRIEQNPQDFAAWIQARVNRYVPSDEHIKVGGFLIVGGSNGGFAFDNEPEFFLNLAYWEDFALNRSVMAHEMYHGVQGARKPWGEAPAGTCRDLATFVNDLYEEGTATLVGDPLLLPETSERLKRDKQNFERGLRNLHVSRTVFELSMAGLQATPPVPYDEVYALGFNGDEILYKLGYTYAKAIETDLGAPALAALLTQARLRFLETYRHLPLYGKDVQHPAFGPHTLRALERLSSPECSAAR